jgi:hypothetical protein
VSGEVHGNIVGAPRARDAQCADLAGGYCAPADVCTRPCLMHADCGCARDTTNGGWDGGGGATGGYAGEAGSGGTASDWGGTGAPGYAGFGAEGR